MCGAPGGRLGEPSLPKHGVLAGMARIPHRKRSVGNYVARNIISVHICFLTKLRFGQPLAGVENADLRNEGSVACRMASFNNAGTDDHPQGRHRAKGKYHPGTTHKNPKWCRSAATHTPLEFCQATSQRRLYWPRYIRRYELDAVLHKKALPLPA